MRNTALHMPGVCRFTPVPVNLRPTGDAGLKELAGHGMVYDGTVLLGVFKHMRAGTNDTHVALQYVQKLRQFIKTGTSQEGTNPSDSTIVARGLFIVTFNINPHAAEFITLKRLVVSSGALLLEQDRTRTFTFDQERYNGIEPT